MIISLNELNKRETGKIDLNFSQKIDNISYCDKIGRASCRERVSSPV